MSIQTTESMLPTPSNLLVLQSQKQHAVITVSSKPFVRSVAGLHLATHSQACGRYRCKQPVFGISLFNKIDHVQKAPTYYRTRYTAFTCTLLPGRRRKTHELHTTKHTTQKVSGAFSSFCVIFWLPLNFPFAKEIQPSS